MDFKNYIDRVNNKLNLYLNNQGSLTESMRYSVLAGGKRFRSILTYTTAQIFSANFAKIDSSACAVELIHTYSLIHDDLPSMDDDDMRNNQLACHQQFGQAQAILTGDGLQALAFDILVNDTSIEAQTRVVLLQLLSKAACQMAEGQMIDVASTNQIISLKALKQMHQKKTGALISCAVKLGAKASSNCNQSDLDILSDFARDIGLAYQIQDDVLDVLTPVETLGKKQNSDFDKNKPNYPALIGLEKSKQAYVDLYHQAQQHLKLLSVNADKLSILTDKLLSREF